MKLVVEAVLPGREIARSPNLLMSSYHNRVYVERKGRSQTFSLAQPWSMDMLDSPVKPSAVQNGTNVLIL